MPTEALLLVVLGAAVFLSALVNGAVGFGFALLTIVALTFVIDPRTAVIVLSVVTPALSLLQIRHHWAHRAVVSRLTVLLVAAAIGSVIGTDLLLILPTWLLSIALGIFAISYVITSLRRHPAPIPHRAERALAPLVGLAAGILNGSLGASGPVLGSYLHAIGLRTRDFAFAISSAFAIMGLVRVASIATLGAYTSATFLFSATIVVPAIAGQRVGFALQRRIDHHRFELAVLALLSLSAANLLIKGAQEALVR